MAQRQVVEVQCGRCDRKEYREPPSLPDPVTKEDEEHRMAAFSAVVVDEHGMPHEVKFDDLCSPCINTIKGHLVQIAKKIEGVSPVRGKRGPAPAVHHETKANGTAGKEKGHAPRA